MYLKTMHKNCMVVHKVDQEALLRWLLEHGEQVAFRDRYRKGPNEWMSMEDGTFVRDVGLAERYQRAECLNAKVYPDQPHYEKFEHPPGVRSSTD